MCIRDRGYEKKLLTITKEQMLNGESLKLNLKMDLDLNQDLHIVGLIRRPLPVCLLYTSRCV